MYISGLSLKNCLIHNFAVFFLVLFVQNEQVAALNHANWKMIGILKISKSRVLVRIWKIDCGLAILAGSSTPEVIPLYKSETGNLNH